MNNNADTTVNLNKASCMPRSEEEAEPCVYVTYHQARELCARRNMRLPTHAEWYQAALGTPDVDGKESCNVDSASVSKTGAYEACATPQKAYDMIGNVWEWIDATVEDGTYNSRELPDSGYVTDADEDGVALATSEEDTTDAFHDDYFWSSQDGSFGMIRGGFYGSRSDGGLYSVQGQVARAFAGEAVGFRCVKDL